MSTDQIAQTLVLSPKEELAVIAQRLQTHIEETTSERCKAKLEAAQDLIKSALHWR